MHYEKDGLDRCDRKNRSGLCKRAEQWSKAAQKKRNLRHFTAMAACVCILLAGAVVSFDLWVQNKDTGAETESAVAEGMNEGTSAPNEGNETAVAKAEEEQTESVESESFADTDEQITINEVSELTTIAIDVGNGQEERMSAEELEQYYGVTVFPKNCRKILWHMQRSMIQIQPMYKAVYSHGRGKREKTDHG